MFICWFLISLRIVDLTLDSFGLQNLVEQTNARDASGNIVLGDIGVHIQQEVSLHIPFIFRKLLCSMILDTLPCELNLLHLTLMKY